MHRILLGVPSSGTVAWSSAQAAFLASLRHKVDVIPSCNSGPNYNNCLTAALNACEAGDYDLHAQIHADLAVVEDTSRWLDILVEEMERHDADFISVPMAIKDHRGVTSCGIGNPENRWNPWRRFTTKEFADLPSTFSAADIGYGDKYLIHNHALCLFDMRKDLWWETDETGCIKAIFNFEERIARDPVSGLWGRSQDSEDWAFSRRLWEMGAKSVITSRVKTIHHGGISFENHGDWGSWKNGDEDTSSQWRPALKAAAL